MSRFWFAIFRNPSTLYTLRFLPWNSGIYWRLHSKPVNASQYVIWHLYPFFSIPISEPTHVGAKPISEPYRCPRIPMSESYQCQSHSNVWAIPMSGPYKCRSQTHVRAFQCPSHTNVRAYQCQSYTNVWAIPVSEPNRCPSIPMSESMLCTATSCFHSFLDRANHTNQKDCYVFDSINRLPCAYCAFKKLIDKIWPQHEKCYRSSYCYTSHHYFWILIDKNKHTTNKLLYF